jgi:hypothetical protein
MQEYVGSGIARFGGCAKTTKTVYIGYKWGENSILYVKYKAQKGILETVAIKRVLLNGGKKTFNKIIPIYQDTLNSLWNENDLILAEEARSLALDYWQKRQEEINAHSCG